jgi:hypothetical protein
MKTTLINSFFILLFFQLGMAQNIKGKSLMPQPGHYANIKVNETVSNAEGFYAI